MELRDYQKAIVENVLKKGNSLIILPTGLGKTIIAFAIMSHFFDKNILFLAPTKPLIKQHFESFNKFYNKKAILISGDLSKNKRIPLYKNNIIFATPQTIKNDLLDINKKFDLIIFDEAHKAIGDYAYTRIAKFYENSFIIGLTASPGGNLERIKQIIKNLNIKNIEIKYTSDKDVKKYLNEVHIYWKYTKLTPILLKVKDILSNLLKKYLETLYSSGLKFNYKSKQDLLKLKNDLLNLNHPAKYALLTTFFLFFNINHMLELLETQGKTALLNYIEKLKTKNSKTSKILINKQEIVYIEYLLKNTKEEHPKINLLLDILKKENKKTILFVQYRDQIKFLNKILNKEGFNSKIFIGKRDGFSRKQQEKTINEFRDGLFDILITSSIGEEGLDIPAVDRIIFYEPVPSEIRSIQRRGRTGRFGKGEVYILITKNTRDEVYYWAAIKKEKMMKKYINRFIKTGSFNKPKTKSLREFF